MSEQQLQKMAQELQEMQSLEGAMADLQDAKNGMNGEGQDGMNQFGDGFNQLGQNGNRRNQGDGQGNRGIGDGARAEAPDNTASYNTKAKNQYTKGAAVVEGTAPPTAADQGPQHHHHPGRGRDQLRLRRRRPDQPEGPQERREAHPGLLRPDQQGRSDRSLDADRSMVGSRADRIRDPSPSRRPPRTSEPVARRRPGASGCR